MDVNLLEIAKGFGTAAPIVGMLAFMWYRADSRLEVERKFWTDKMLSLISESIEAEKDMTQALNLLSGKIK